MRTNTIVVVLGKLVLFLSDTLDFLTVIIIVLVVLFLPRRYSVTCEEGFTTTF